MSDEQESLADALARLPVNTPFFIPDEVLALWFPPWFGEGSPDSESLKMAEEAAARCGCLFTYDDFMKSWCFIKQPTSN